jgi:glycosyltransferase involved in cell wall biosynthesis
MRIAIYCHSIAPSIDGVCRRYTGILEEMCRQGHEILLFTLEEQPEELPAALKKENIVTLPYFFMPAYPDKKVAKPTFVAMYTIYRKLLQFRPEIIHVTSDGIAQMFALTGLLVGVPVVGAFHTDIVDLVKSRDANWFQQSCILFKEFVDCRVMNSCATTSKSFSRKLAVQGAKIDHIIHTAVNSKTFHPSKLNKELRSELTFGHPEAFLCVYVGRISREKNLEVIVEALKGIDDAYLAIIGDGPEGATYASRHSRHNRIYCKPRFLGHHELAEVSESASPAPVLPATATG